MPYIQTEEGRIKIVQDNEYDNYEDISGLFTIGEITTSVNLVSENDSSPVSSLINFPNPFYDWINVEFNIAKTANVNISIYNSSGQQMLTLKNGILHPDKYNMTNGAFLPQKI